MAIVLKPCRQPIAMAQSCQFTDVVVSHGVRHKTSKIPKKARGHILVVHDLSVKNRQIWSGIIVELNLEGIQHTVSPILASGLITVLDNDLQSTSVIFRNSTEQFSDKRVIVKSNVSSVHFVHLKSCGFR